LFNPRAAVSRIESFPVRAFLLPWDISFDRVGRSEEEGITASASAHLWITRIITFVDETSKGGVLYE
jgi:hypothetical protein